MTKNKSHAVVRRAEQKQRPADIPLLDIKLQNQSLKKELHRAATETIDSGSYILGKATQKFEKDFGAFIRAPYTVGVGSGTDALVFGLLAAGVRPGDEVIVPSFTFMSSALAILHIGAVPVFCDVEYQYYTLDPEALKRALSKKTKAVMVVHLFGQTANMDEITKICKKAKIKIVEDACQAHGATWRGKKAGILGDSATFSFYPTKNLGGLGDGGILTTQHKHVYEKVLQHRNLGRSSMAVTSYDEIGWTSRLDSLQAALLSVKLKKLNAWNAARQKIAGVYNRELKGLGLGLPEERPQGKHVYHLYVIRVPGGKRNALKNYLSDKGIRTGIYYEKGIHEQPLLKKYRHRKTTLAITEKLSSEVLALPVYPGLSARDQKHICSSIQTFFKS